MSLLSFSNSARGCPCASPVAASPAHTKARSQLPASSGWLHHQHTSPVPSAARISAVRAAASSSIAAPSAPAPAAAPSGCCEEGDPSLYVSDRWELAAPPFPKISTSSSSSSSSSPPPIPSP